MATFIQNGDVIDYTAAADIAAGDVVTLGTTKCGVAIYPITSGALGAVTVRGVFAIAASATEFAVGDAVYFNTTSKKATKTNSDVPLGTCVEAAASGAATVKVLLG